MISFLSKHKSYILTLLLTLGVVYSTSLLAAPTQQTLGFQGEFFNYGTPGNAPVQATFTFHTTETGNTPSGSTITKIIPVVHGYFATEFTDTDTQGVDFNQQLYLEISINGTTLAPRTPVRPSVASFKTFGTFSHATPPTPGIAGSLYFNTTTNELYVSTGSSWQLAGTASTTIQWTPNGTSLNYMAGNVGVGTSTPSAKLDVVGDVNVTVASQSDRTTGFKVTGTAGDPLILSNFGNASNLFVGNKVGVNATGSLGYYNTIFGLDSGLEIADASSGGGYGNSFFGFGAGRVNSTGIANTFLGNNAGRTSTTGSYNTVVGTNAGYSFSNGSNNVFLGSHAGINQTAGSNNILIGTGVNAANLTGGDQLNIGNAIYGNLSNGNIGIGTSNPTAKLFVENGAIAIKNNVNSSAELNITNQNNDSDSSAVMRLFSGSNAGLIGLTSPSYTTLSQITNSLFLRAGGSHSINLVTPDAQPIKLFTNNTQRLTVEANGNITIPTTGANIAFSGTFGGSANIGADGAQIYSASGIPLDIRMNGGGAISGQVFKIDTQSTFANYLQSWFVAGTRAGYLLNTGAYNAPLELNAVGGIGLTGGNVGIRTTNATHALTVNGTVKVLSNNKVEFGNETLTVGDAGGLGYIRWTAGTAAADRSDITVDGNRGLVFKSGAYNAGGAAFVLNSGNALSSSLSPLLVLQNQGVEKFRVSANGSVGIGTSTPDSSFVVQNGNYGSALRIGTGMTPGAGVGIGLSSFASPNPNYVIEVSNSGPFSVYETATGESFGFGSVAGIATLSTEMYKAITSGSAVYPSFALSMASGQETGMYLISTSTIGFSTARTERIRIDPNGNLGIGTTNPTSKLTLGGGIGAANGITFTDGGGNTQNLYMDGGNTIYSGGHFNAAFEVVARTGAGSQTTIGATGPVGQPGIRLNDQTLYRDFGYIRTDGSFTVAGNVGVGTTTPEVRLEVVGSAGQDPFYVSTSTGMRQSFAVLKDGSVSIGGNNSTGLGKLVIYQGGVASTTNSSSGITLFNHSGSTGRFYVDSLSNTRIDAFINGGGVVALNGSGSGSVGIGTTTPSAQLTTTGSVRFASLGSGGANLITDSLGNVTVSSDERLKDIQGDYISGLDQIKGIQPITYRWKTETGYDTIATYAGFSAQNVQQFIPEAVTEDSRGFLTLADRPILATLVNAVRELALKFEGISEKFTTKELCLEEVCINKEQLKVLLQNANQNVQSTQTPTQIDEPAEPEEIVSSSTDPVIPEETPSEDPVVIDDTPVDQPLVE